MANKATSVKVDLQNGTTTTVYATWAWSKSNTNYYSVQWRYATGDGKWFVGENTTTTSKQSVYNAPSNATKVKFRVKPVSTTYKNKKKKTVSYWTADWSTEKIYTFSSNPPDTPSVPTVVIEKYKLTAEVDCYDTKTAQIEFQVVKNDKSIFSSGKATVTKNHASYSCTVQAGAEYKVRCRGVRNKETGSWSEYSSGSSTIPSAPTGFTSLEATSSTSVTLTWKSVSTAKNYTIEYTTKKDYFDSSPDNVKSVTVETSHTEITGLDTGETWYFRLQANNDSGGSGFCDPVSITLGKSPSAPTTWSLSSTAMVGDDIVLYWVHNSEDGSSQTYAELELTINGSTSTISVQNSTDEVLKDKTSSYSLSTSAYTAGTVILWRVRTRGVLADYGDWSIQRTITVYAPATLEFNSEIPEVLESYPLSISVNAGPSTQNAIRFFISIVANETYETLNYDGTSKWISAGEEIYSSNFNGDGNTLNVDLMPSDVNLDNNVPYTLTVSVSMDSGLSAELSADFAVGWMDEELEPNAEIGFDEDSLVAYIAPYCLDSSENSVTDVTLSVYRREFDGTYTEIATGLDGGVLTTVTDPHPALDMARYRVVAISNTTGSIGFYDVPGYDVGEVSVVIQWNEDWISFDANGDDDDDQPTWSGSMLKLPYNIDVADDHNPDIVLVEYIGRKHPVSYYGSQRGETATWNMDIEKDDEETLYALRRLSVYQGDVYVREPSGSGYWASIKVSFSQKHNDVIIPVTLNITRVEGGA